MSKMKEKDMEKVSGGVKETALILTSLPTDPSKLRKFHMPNGYILYFNVDDAKQIERKILPIGKGFVYDGYMRSYQLDVEYLDQAKECFYVDGEWHYES